MGATPSGDLAWEIADMREVDEKWMAYIDREVRSACAERGWGFQVRRKWSVREKPVSESSIEDYEWKLIPGSSGQLPEQLVTTNDEGVYYVLGFDPRSEKFILQHDTAQCGDLGPHLDLWTYTEIRLSGSLFAGVQRRTQEGMRGGPDGAVAPDGWLRNHLVDLTTRFGPSRFSIT